MTTAFQSGSFQQNAFQIDSAALTHVATGTLAGDGATLSGTAARVSGAVTHSATGVLAGAGATLTGSALRFRAHAASGSLAGAGATLTGSALRFRAHAANGTLAGAGATLAGSAARSRVAVNHSATGVLAAGGATLVGIALHAPLYPDPADVRDGVHYGPGGIYVGTLTVGTGDTIIALRPFTERH